MSSLGSLTSFHPVIRRWFTREVGVPTDIQERAWPVIAAGEHVLVTAPTGSGKTLTAFLWAINSFLCGDLGGGRVRVLYVSPLKALNNDIARNLLRPLEALRRYAEEENVVFPQIRVATRSGDTPEQDRRRMAKRPPEILITTPESLNLLITSQRGRDTLQGLSTVILDEIHAIAEDKRGTYLMTAVERLTLLSGEFQRIALSATVRPTDLIAEMIGAYRQTSSGHSPRPVQVIDSSAEKVVEVSVRCPSNIHERLVDGDRYPALIESFRSHIDANRSTLIFANNRKLTEKISRMINISEDTPVCFSHHGSLSREVRTLVEERFKNGELSAIAATNSLELGIDIGDLDEVLLINAPRTLSSGVQRVGRAGHGVGATSRGAIYPTFEHGFIDAAVMAPLITQRDCEAIRPIRAPLDVLAQVIVAMAVNSAWAVDDLYEFLRCPWAYQNLKRSDFDTVIEMLAGRYADSRIRELEPRLHFDRVDNTISARRGARLLLYRAGGVIPDRGYYDIRLEDTNALIGSLDEEFVWERKAGDEFTIGTQAWKVRRITYQDVIVAPAPKLGMPPFWRGEAIDRDFSLCERIGDFLAECGELLGKPELEQKLGRDHFLDDQSVAEILTHLHQQVEATGPELPHRHHVLVEHYDDPHNTTDNKRVVIHAIWGGRILRPLSICLSAAWEQKYGTSLEVVASDEAIALTLPHTFVFDDLLELVPSDAIDQLLRMKLESTGFFGARFRENAARALLLPKKNLKRRLPLWLNRLRARKLLQATSRYDDFPILVETWRSCLQDAFDLNGLRARLDELRDGTIHVTEVTTNRPSPFARDVIWQGTNRYMYQDDTPEGGPPSKLKPSLFEQVLRTSSMRPRLPLALAEELQAKLQRTYPGYAPSDERDILALLSDRLVVPDAEWSALLTACERDGEEPLEVELLHTRAVFAKLPEAKERLVIAIERLPYLLASLDLSQDDIDLRGLENEPLPTDTKRLVQKQLTGQVETRETDSLPIADSSLDSIVIGILSYYGPTTVEKLCALLGPLEGRLDAAVERLAHEGRVICDLLLEGSEALEICDSENLERLLRILRTSHRPSLEPLGAEFLPLFVASLHQMTERGENLDTLKTALERLFGFAAPAALWETDILPARLSPYYQAWLDSILQESDLIWYGRGQERVGFCFRDWLDLFLDRDDRSLSDPSPSDEHAPLLTSEGRFTFHDLQQRTGLLTADLTERLWGDVWQGRLSNDTYVSLRQGIQSKFAPVDLRSSNRRTRFGGWVSSQSATGAWFVLPQTEAFDLLEEQEANRDRVRQLFARYGVLFRERLVHEPKAMQWRSVFSTLRLMEFSGEAISGYFFEGIRGAQFIDHRAFRRLQQDMSGDSVYWINAADPISVCGLGLDVFKNKLPPRLPSTHLVYRGAELLLVSRRLGRAIELRLEPDDPTMGELLGVFKDLLGRQFSPLKQVVVETINDEPAVNSPYLRALKDFGFDREVKELVLRKTY